MINDLAQRKASFLYLQFDEVDEINNFISTLNIEYKTIEDFGYFHEKDFIFNPHTKHLNTHLYINKNQTLNKFKVF